MMRASIAVIAWILVLGGACALVAAPAAAADTALRYDRDILPILAENCLSCHGPGKQEAGLRLDTAGGSTASLDSGMRGIVPGEPAASELLARIRSTDADTQMPPPHARKTLSDEEKALFLGIDPMPPVISPDPTWC